MYPEFVAIYIGLAVVFAMLIAVIIMLILIMKKVKNTSSTPNYSYMNSTISASSMGNVAFCKKCATQLEPSQRCCPKCGTQR